MLEQGGVSQIGTHDELMLQKGHYREIAAVQLYGDEAMADENEPSHVKRMRGPIATAAGHSAQPSEAPAA